MDVTVENPKAACPKVAPTVYINSVRAFPFLPCIKYIRLRLNEAALINQDYTHGVYMYIFTVENHS